MVNLELYRIFTIVAKEENITKASQILNISQPAVTKHIKNLEYELQLTLFKRYKHGMLLTEQGQALFDAIKDSVTLLSNIDKKFRETKDINLGVHITMLSKMFSTCIGEYYKKHEKSKVNVINENVDIMLSKLANQELDIVLSKKTNENMYDNKKIKFISLGKLHDIFVVNTHSPLLNKVLTKNDLKHEIIYTPRKSSLTTQNLMKSLGLPYDKEVNYIKNMTYSTMLGIIKNDTGIGIITKEYILDELKENKISVLKTDFELEPLEFGLYINSINKFNELNDFIKILKNSSQVNYN